MNPNAIIESGKLYLLKENAKELNITPMQYLYSESISKIEHQFGCFITRSVYGKKYEEYLNYNTWSEIGQVFFRTFVLVHCGN